VTFLLLAWALAFARAQQHGHGVSEPRWKNADVQLDLKTL